MTAASGRLPLARSAVALSAVALVLAGCSAGSSGAGAPAAVSGSPPSSVPASATPKKAAASSFPSSPVPHLSPPNVPGVTWRAAGSVVNGVAATYLATVAGGSVGLMWIDPSVVSFRFIPGYKVPEGSPSTKADNQPSTWVPRMVAAFNGGFMLKDADGGYYVDHTMVRALVPRLAAMQITSDGKLSVGAWGRDFHLTPQTVAVRQNLRLLVDQGVAQTSAADTARTWGIANGGLWTANRSALGQRADRSLVFAYGHEVRPSAMAAALVRVGVQRAIALDMNKSWPSGFVYRHGSGSSPGAIVGLKVHPLMYRSASMYYARFTKDFVAVLRR